MDLIAGYLLIILILFSANLALLLGNYKIDNIKLLGISLFSLVISFVLINISTYLKDPLLFLMDYFGYLFFVIAIAIFAVMLFYTKYDGNLNYSISSVSFLFAIAILLLASQSKLLYFDIILYSLFVFIIVFLVYKLTKLLIHAKRPYPIIIGEYMTLFSILMFIFALTYNSTKELDYSMFSPFLILTPTYQLIYVIIAIVVIMVGGVLLNDVKGGNS